MRYSPRVTVCGLDCALVQLQMYTAEKDVITSKSGRIITEWNISASGCADDKEPQNQFHIPVPCNTQHPNV